MHCNPLTWNLAGKSITYFRRYLNTSVEPLAFAKVSLSSLAAFSLRSFGEVNAQLSFAVQQLEWCYKLLKKLINDITKKVVDI